MRLKGLDPNKKYRLEEINLYPGTKSAIKSEQLFSGDFLMNIGFNPEVNTNRTSVIVKITEAISDRQNR
ncbi:GH36 C-terminal domain-containing protein [Pedobacter sp. NJ-S-72]